MLQREHKTATTTLDYTQNPREISFSSQPACRGGIEVDTSRSCVAYKTNIRGGKLVGAWVRQDKSRPRSSRVMSQEAGRQQIYHSRLTKGLATSSKLALPTFCPIFTDSFAVDRGLALGNAGRVVEKKNDIFHGPPRVPREKEPVRCGPHVLEQHSTDAELRVEHCEGGVRTPWQPSVLIFSFP